MQNNVRPLKRISVFYGLTRPVLPEFVFKFGRECASL